MSATTETKGIPTDVMADLQHATELATTGRKDPEFDRRIRDKAARIREDILRRNGVLDIGVPALRELRDAE